MNILNRIRNKDLPCIFTLIILFTSCTSSEENYDGSDFKNIKENSVESVVKKHLEKMSHLAYIFKNEKNINLNILEKSPKFFENTSKLKKTLIKAKIENTEEVTMLLFEIQENMNMFLNDYISKNNFNENEINKIISLEINKQLDANQINNSNLTQSSSCESQCYRNYSRSNSRCERNWYIGIAGVAVSGFFTLGVGTIIGAGVVGTMLLVCENDSQNDRDECIRNCKNGGGKEDDDPRAPLPL